MSDMQTVKIQITKTNSIEIPLIIFLLTQFFNENPTLLDTEGIFRVNGDKKVIDDIKVHRNRHAYAYACSWYGALQCGFARGRL